MNITVSKTYSQTYSLILFNQLVVESRILITENISNEKSNGEETEREYSIMPT